MIVNHDDSPTPPPCFNRPPRETFYTRHGINSETGEVMAIPIRFDWASEECAITHGVGIGPPTEKYPAGTPYHIAHGFLEWCKVCPHAGANLPT